MSVADPKSSPEALKNALILIKMMEEISPEDAKKMKIELAKTIIGDKLAKAADKLGKAAGVTEDQPKPQFAAAPWPLNQEETEVLTVSSIFMEKTNKPGIQIGSDYQQTVMDLGTVQGKIAIPLPKIEVFVGYVKDLGLPYLAAASLPAGQIFDKQPAFVVVGPGFSRFYTQEEREAIICHELGHIASGVVLDEQNSREEEFKADSFAAHYGYSQALIACLEKLVQEEARVSGKPYEQLLPGTRARPDGNTTPSVAERIKRLKGGTSQ